MKKVLYICPTSSIGGAETFLLQTATHGHLEEYENHYLLFRTGPLYDRLSKLNVHVHVLKSPPQLSNGADRKMVSQKMIEIINDNNINLVHSTMAYGALFAARTCKSMGIPHVWFQHGPASGWMDRLAAVLPHNGLVVNSHFTGKTQRCLENPMRFFIPRNNPIEKILLGTDEIEFSNDEVENHKKKILTQLEMDSSTTLIGMLCRIQEWKGVHIFLDAIAELNKDKTLPHFCGVIWGEAFKGKEYYNKLVEKVQNENLPVLFAGHSENAHLSLATCDILVNASIQPEPFGLSIIEAMTVGTVPIVPDEGGPIEIVSNGKNGLWFNSRSSRSLAKHIRKLLSDSKLRQTLSENAKSTSKQKYTADRAITHLENFHKKIMG